MENNKKNNNTKNVKDPKDVKANTNKHEQNETIDYATKEKLLLKQIDELKQQVVNLDKKCEQYELNIKNINHDYADKITKKMQEANQLIANKIKELNDKHTLELDNAKKFVAVNTFSQLADVIEQFALAVNFNVADEKIKNYQLGFKMYLAMFNNILSSNNVEVINLKIGDEFDEKIMEVVDIVIDPSKKENTIAAIISNPYKLHDRIIKIGKVKIFRKK